MNGFAVLPLLIVYSVIDVSATENIQTTKRYAELHMHNKTSHIQNQRLKREWIWKRFLVPEEDPTPQIIGQLKSDSDKGDYTIKYLLSGEGAGEIFKIDEYSGEIYTLKKLDREEKSFYVLQAQAINRKTNQPVEPESEFIIKVQDINDNAPQFQNEPYVSVIPEMSPTGTTVLQVTATDDDDPAQGNNAKLIYSILQGEPYFSVEPKTGIIVTSWPNMDRETREKYHVVVQVKDMMGLPGGFSATTTVTVILSDVNDNGPIFQHSLYTLAVAESAPVGTTVGRIKADDNDVGINAKMNYSLEESEGNSTFQILTDPITNEGVILLAQTLDYETKKRFVIAAEVTDEHVDTRFLDYNEFRDRTIVKILVEDIDEPPVFLEQEYKWKIHENMSAGTTVGVIIAKDSDGANNPIRYTFDRDSNIKKLFKIDQNNGTVTTVKPLDRESASWYNLTVIAKETKQNHLFSSALVFINVLDVNDNAPQFPKTYQPYVCEGVPSGELIQLVSAVDPDDPMEGHHFYFSLVQGEKINPNFTLRDNQDNTAGILTRRSTFTRQAQSRYLLPVVIADSGIPSLSSTTTLTISVCGCSPAGHCPISGVQALALSVGLSVHTFFGILASVLTVLVFAVLVLLVRWHRKRPEEKVKQDIITEPWSGLSEKVLRYSTSEAEIIPDNCPPVFLRHNSKRRDKRRLSRHEVANSIRMSLRQSCHIGVDDEVFRQFIEDRLHEADNDPCVPPFDSLRTYSFEGTGSPAGSLSSLGSLASEINAEQPQAHAPRFMKLALWHGATEEETNF